MLTQLSICIILVKLMSLAEQSFADFQAVLDRHRANETAYKDRLKEINLTRSKIADQLEALQQTYDKKLRGLQQKLQALRGQNDTLLRENTLYRSEIQTYQSRLLEKEKIIAALLSQRRDLPVVGSSEKSKSDKTDSLNANEEENKAFKKQAVFKEDYDHPVSSHQKFKQESPVQRHVEPIVPPKHEKPVERPAPPKKKVAPLVLPQEITNEKPSLPHVEEPPKAIEKTETVEVKHTLPPPPPPRAGKQKEKVKPMKNPFNYTAPNEENLDANNFFSNLGKVQTQEVKPVEEVHVVKEIYEQQPDFRQENHHFQQEEISAPAEAEYEETPHIQQEQPEEAAHQQQQNQFQQQFQQPQFEQQTKNEYKHYKEQEFQPQPQEDQTYTPEPSQQSSDFLSHFNTQPQTNNYYQPLPIKPKPKKKNTRTVARQEVPAEPVDPQANGNDFFAQLSKGEHEHHQLDNIEQSSIDHIDRDNSLLSNEQPYFTQEPAPKRPVKMSKKKKRDQIKMMDPSCFE